MACNKLHAGVGLIVLGFVLFVMMLALGLKVIPDKLEDAVNENIVFPRFYAAQGKTFRKWESNDELVNIDAKKNPEDFPLNLRRMYMWHIENVDDFLGNATKPYMTLKGPYSFNQLDTVYRFSHDETTGTVTSKSWSRTVFLPELSSPDSHMDDTVSHINSVFLGIVHKLTSDKVFFQIATKELLNKFEPMVHIQLRRKIEELLFRRSIDNIGWINYQINHELEPFIANYTGAVDKYIVKPIALSIDSKVYWDIIKGLSSKEDLERICSITVVPPEASQIDELINLSDVCQNYLLTLDEFQAAWNATSEKIQSFKCGPFGEFLKKDKEKEKCYDSLIAKTQDEKSNEYLIKCKKHTMNCLAFLEKWNPVEPAEVATAADEYRKSDLLKNCESIFDYGGIVRSNETCSKFFEKQTTEWITSSPNIFYGYVYNMAGLYNFISKGKAIRILSNHTEWGLGGESKSINSSGLFKWLKARYSPVLTRELAEKFEIEIAEVAKVGEWIDKVYIEMLWPVYSKKKLGRLVSWADFKQDVFYIQMGSATQTMKDELQKIPQTQVISKSRASSVELELNVYAASKIFEDRLSKYVSEKAINATKTLTFNVEETKGLLNVVKNAMNLVKMKNIYISSPLVKLNNMETEDLKRIYLSQCDGTLEEDDLLIGKVLTVLFSPIVTPRCAASLDLMQFLDKTSLMEMFGSYNINASPVAISDEVFPRSFFNLFFISEYSEMFSEFTYYATGYGSGEPFLNSRNGNSLKNSLSPVMSHTVKELIKGYKDDLLQSITMECCVPGILVDHLHMANISNVFPGTIVDQAQQYAESRVGSIITFNTGEKNISNINKYEKYILDDLSNVEDPSTVPEAYFPGVTEEWRKFNRGTDGKQFPPKDGHLTKGHKGPNAQRYEVYVSQIFRSVPLDYEKDEKLSEYDIHVNRFGLARNALNVDKNNNQAYGFTKDGMFPLIHAKGLPLYVSLPFFMFADPTFVEQLENVVSPTTPSETEQWLTKIWVDPLTGSTLKANKRLQANLQIPSLGQRGSMPLTVPNSAGTIVPYFIICEENELTYANAHSYYKNIMKTQKLSTLLAIIGGINGCLLIIIGIVLIFLHRRQGVAITESSTTMMKEMPKEVQIE